MLPSVVTAMMKPSNAWGKKCNIGKLLSDAFAEEHDTEAQGPPLMALALLPNPQTVSANDLTASTFPSYTQDGFAHHLSSSGKVLAKSLRIR